MNELLQLQNVLEFEFSGFGQVDLQIDGPELLFQACGLRSRFLLSRCEMGQQGRRMTGDGNRLG